MLRLDDIIEKARAYLPLSEEDVETLKRAYVYSAKVHSGQKRISGEPYLSHPLEVTGILAEMRLGVPTLVTGLLHDTVEDTLATIEEIETLFGPEVAFLVEGVTKISKLPMSSKLAEQAENFRKLILATAKDIRVVLVKLADRLHNMRTLGHLSEERRLRIARETMEIYAPLAHRLGIYWMATELEDLAFRYMEPGEYERLYKLVASKKKEWNKYVREATKILDDKLREYGIEAEITGRFKHLYGIYRKIRSYNIDVEQLHDIIAFRIITTDRKTCYEALGAVHATWKPVPGRFKDYIALPKGNGYQSLHTCVIGPFGELMEIQIRSRKMHEVAEYGIAAHWKYKEGGEEAADDDNVHFYANLRRLLEWKDIKDPREYLEAIKGELLPHSMVYVFTPKGDLKELPFGATPIDFAYYIHTDVGNHCARATVNGRIVPLDYKLRSGDIVEITTSNDQHPRRDWLKMAVTSRAKTRIRAWLRAQERRESRGVGRSIVERRFKQHGLDFNAMLARGELDEPLARLGFKSADDFFTAVGFGRVAANDLVSAVLPAERRLPADKEERIERIIRTMTPGDTGIKVQGYGNVLIRVARCCSPLPGEPIRGFITRGRGITVHRENCPQLLGVDPERRIELEWDERSNVRHIARIEVTCADEPGMLSNISNSIAASDVNISKAEIHSTHDDKALGTFDVAVRSIEQLKGVMESIRKVKGVISVARVPGGEAPA